jgi:hypothetical protein
MLQITEHAATVIAEACDAQELAESGGLRIAYKTAVHDGSVRSLLVEYVDRPQASDTVVREGPAAIFLADGVDRVVAGRILDAERDGMPPRLVLRSQAATTDGA